MKSIIYPGTFDPITHGHVDIIERALKLFDRVIVAIAANRDKHPLLTLDERIRLAQRVLKKHAQVEVVGFDNLLIDFAKARQVSVVLRGLRMVADFEYEYQLIGMNRHLDHNLETIFLMPGEKYAYISASLVREVARLGGDVSPFVAPIVAQALKKAVIA